LDTRTTDNENVKGTEWVRNSEVCVHVVLLGTLAVDTWLVQGVKESKIGRFLDKMEIHKCLRRAAKSSDTQMTAR